MINTPLSIGQYIQCIDQDSSTCSHLGVFKVIEVQKDGWITIIADKGSQKGNHVDAPPECFQLL